MMESAASRLMHRLSQPEPDTLGYLYLSLSLTKLDFSLNNRLNYLSRFLSSVCLFFLQSQMTNTHRNKKKSKIHMLI